MENQSSATLIRALQARFQDASNVVCGLQYLLATTSCSQAAIGKFAEASGEVSMHRARSIHSKIKLSKTSCLNLLLSIQFLLSSFYLPLPAMADELPANRKKADTDDPFVLAVTSTPPLRGDT